MNHKIHYTHDKMRAIAFLKEMLAVAESLPDGDFCHTSTSHSKWHEDPERGMGAGQEYVIRFQTGLSED